MKETSSQAGFTLIELLVVIAIIGLLSSVVLASLSGARESARDSRRFQDIRQIQTALELYINENGQPPTVDGGRFYTSHNSSSSQNLEWATLESKLAPHIGSLPADPVNEWPLAYYYGTDPYGQCPSYDGQSYVMFVATEVSSIGWKEYEIQGENGSAHRYCVYP